MTGAGEGEERDGEGTLFFKDAPQVHLANAHRWSLGVARAGDEHGEPRRTFGWTTLEKRSRSGL